jgi:hypothetical protein
MFTRYRFCAGSTGRFAGVYNPSKIERPAEGVRDAQDGGGEWGSGANVGVSSSCYQSHGHAALCR